MQKDYDLLQDGNDWVILFWNDAQKHYVKLITFHHDAWGEYTEAKAISYIHARKQENDLIARVLLKVKDTVS